MWVHKPSQCNTTLTAECTGWSWTYSSWCGAFLNVSIINKIASVANGTVISLYFAMIAFCFASSYSVSDGSQNVCTQQQHQIMIISKYMLKISFQMLNCLFFFDWQSTCSNSRISISIFKSFWLNFQSGNLFFLWQPSWRRLGDHAVQMIELWSNWSFRHLKN